MIVPFLLLMSPFIQLGVSYYASVASFMLVIGIFAWRHLLFCGLSRSGLLALITLLMPLAMAGGPSAEAGADLLRIAREGLMFIILLGGVAGARNVPILPLKRPPLSIVAILVSLLLVLTVIQTFAIYRGVYIGFPQEAYSQDTNTIATELSLRYMSDVLRPNATFAEPSYLSFILLCFAYMIWPLAGRSRLALITIGLIVLNGMLTRSLSFFLAFPLVFFVPSLFERSNRRGRILALSAVMMTTLALTSASTLVERLANAGTSNVDASMLVRVFAPLKAILPYLLENPLGSPASDLHNNLLRFVVSSGVTPDDVLDSGLLNMVFYYGLVGIAMIGILMVAAPNWRTRFFLIACMNFNGAFLGLDKAIMILTAIGGWEVSARYIARGTGTFRGRNSTPSEDNGLPAYPAVLVKARRT